MLCGGFGNNDVPNNNNNNKFQLQSFVNRVMKVRNFLGGVLLKENSVPARVCV